MKAIQHCHGEGEVTQWTSATPDATSGPRLKLFIAEFLKNLGERYLAPRIDLFLVFRVRLQ